MVKKLLNSVGQIITTALSIRAVVVVVLPNKAALMFAL